jgi:hypothetical protein
MWGDMFKHRTPKRAESTVVELPDGSTTTLDRPFSEYTIAELAELGITPGMGSGADIWVIPSRRHRWRRRA